MSVRLVSRAFATVALMVAATAFAGGPLSVCNIGGGGTPIPVKYPGNGTVTLNYDGGAGVLGSRTKAQADALVAASVANWTNVATATITINRGADLPVDVTIANYTTYYNNFSDGLNPVIYDTDGSITDMLLGTGSKNNVLGFAGSNYSLSGSPPNQTCAYAEGRAVLNGSIAISDATFRTVITHEIGHLIGLDHSQLDSEQGLAQANYALMYPIAYRTTDALHEDDAAAITALYPEPTMSATYGQITGNLTAVDGVTAVRGANIWAKEMTTGKVYSVVSDYLQQNTGFFKLLLPPGTYNLFAGAIKSGFTGGSRVGPYTTNSSDLSFQAPLYNAGVPITARALGGGSPTPFVIVAGCAATASFRLDGVGSIGGNCGSITPEVFPVNGVIPAGWVTPGAAQTTDLITNPGFEQGGTGWLTNGGWTVGTSNPHAGNNAAQSGGINVTGTLYQSVSIPAGSTSATLSFWLAIQTQEAAGGPAFDAVRFEIYDASGTFLEAKPSFSNVDAGSYRQVSYNLAAYAGQTILVAFTATNDNLLPTTFFIDDVSLSVTAATPWTVATDQAFEGIYSLKSGAVANGGSSDITYSATFAAGTVSFARRVSSQAGSDFLRFYIDSVLQGEWSGEVAFSVVSFPLAAGTHLLRWSYQKDASGSAGSDAAWIDSVVLPAGTPAYSVTISKAGSGTGTVQSAPAGINCGLTCFASFQPGAAVLLNPLASSGSTFSGWSGACTGNQFCNVTVNGALSVTATFDVLPTFPLTVNVVGSGTVIGPGINCPGDCSESFTSNISVSLTATPAVGMIFTGWSGDCTGTGDCLPTMTAARAVTATFVPAGTLNVTVSGAGTVTSNPIGIFCPADCTETYAGGTVVTLTPVASGGSTFLGWSGACTGTGSCIVNVAAANTYSVTATFATNTNVALAANGGVATASSSANASTPVAAVNNGDRTGKPFGAGGTWADGNPGTFPDWVRIDFAGNRLVNRIVVVTSQDDYVNAVDPSDAQTFTLYGITNFTVETWDGTSWNVIQTVTNNNLVKRTFDITPVLIDRIRISIQGSKDGAYSRIAEIEAYGITDPLLQNLTVTKSGTGSGTVASTVPASPTINCGPTCVATFSTGATVTLQATPAVGSSFTGWSGGGCSGTGSCVVTLDASKTVTATFAIQQLYMLSVSRSGDAAAAASVTSSPAGITCGATCSASFVSPAVVTLTAVAAGGTMFTGWSGAGCSGTGTCIVTMDQVRSVSAAFTMTPTADSDADGIPNAVETQEGRNPFAKDNDIFGNARLFAMQQYRDFLGREGDAGGITFYTNAITGATSTRSQVIENFLASPEFQSGLPQCTRLYFSFFLRIPDYSGLLFQVDAFRAGTPLEAIAQNFYNSPEFTARYGALSNDDYINLVYQNVLGRAPDPGGFAFYKNLLDTNAITKGQMMIGFSESPEFQQISNDEVYVTAVYVGMLRRTPDAAGLDFYLNVIAGGTPRNSIITGFFNSPEYHNRFLP